MQEALVKAIVQTITICFIVLGGFRFKKDPESWLGLVDGIYAVSMTILIVSTPTVIKGMFAQSKSYYPGLKYLDLYLVTNLLLFTFITLAVFIISCDAWTFQRKQIQSMEVMDQLHSINHAIGLFCSALFPSIFLVRWSYSLNYQITLQDTLLDWLIAAQLFIIYIVILNAACREALFNAIRKSHRTKRRNDFAILALRRRLSGATSLAIIILTLRLAGFEYNGSALFLPLFAFFIVVERWAKSFIFNNKIARYFRSRFK